MNETSTKTNRDGFDDGCKAEADEMSSEELMQEMNEAMKNGDKSRAQELLKRWEASLSC
jgi:methanogenic corrinoid protein MtbC1